MKPVINSSTIFIRTPFYPYERTFSPKEITNYFSRPEFKDAIFFASKSLFNVLESELKTGTIRDSTFFSLTKYLLRMQSRCTPFGLFAGVTVAAFGTTTNIVLKPKEDYTKHVRLDALFIDRVIQDLKRSDDVKGKIKWFVNNTLYQVGTNYRYVDYQLDNGHRRYSIATTERSESLDLVIAAARNGTMISNLVNILGGEGYSHEECIDFIDSLILGNFLTSELDLRVTGPEPQQRLADFADRADGSSNELLPGIRKLIDTTNNLGATTAWQNEATMKGVTDLLTNHSGGDQDLQVDLVKPALVATLSDRIKKDVEACIFYLVKNSTSQENDRLENFKKEFIKRYEGREVPLYDVLDPESGIGYPAGQGGWDPNPLLDEIDWAENANTLMSVEKKSFADHLKLVMSSLREGDIEVNLPVPSFSQAEKEKLAAELPPSFRSLCSVIASSASAVDNGDYLIIHRGTYGPSSTNLMGRYCNADPLIEAEVKKLADEESSLDPSAVYAEVVHLDKARVGNILTRPVFREYEIPILTQPSLDQASVISLDDLMISVRNDKVVLRSIRLNKEVIPRHTSAHNYSRSTIPFYYFLCEVQFQFSNISVNWDWGILKDASFLPRVKLGKAILSPASWAVTWQDLKLTQDSSFDRFAVQLKGLLKKWSVPDRIALVDGDAVLPVSAEHDVTLKILFRELKKSGSIRLEESFDEDKHLLVQSAEGKFISEFIIPWTKCAPLPASSPQPMVNGVHGKTRTFMPLSDWCYVKIYCGTGTADLLLTDYIEPLATTLHERDLISKWFFIRYMDPDHHLRVRFRVNEKNALSLVMEELNHMLQHMTDLKLTWKIQFDTYNRELERYGPSNIECSESLFWIDSSFTCRALRIVNESQQENFRWLLAAVCIDAFITMFGLDPAARSVFVKGVRSGFSNEFNGDSKEMRTQLARKVRDLKGLLDTVLISKESGHDENWHAIMQLIAERNRDLENLADTIRQNIAKDGSNKYDVIASYNHMFINRLFRSRRRQSEFLIYDMLSIFYDSRLARNSQSAG